MNLKEAAQQALEALSEYEKSYPAVADAFKPLRTALADTQDWDEIEALRASLREHMAEIKRLREAGRQALGALQFCSPLIEDYGDEEQLAIRHKALAGLTEYAMQRLADEQQMIERGTKAWADVPDATAWVDEMRGNVPAPTSQESRQVEPVGYGVFEDGNLHDSFRLEHEAKLFAALKGEHAEVGALYRSPPNQSEDTLGMVEPVAWMRADRGHVDFHKHPDYLPLYTTLPQHKPLTEEEKENTMPITDDNGEPLRPQYRVIEQIGNWYLLYDQYQNGEAVRHEFRIQKLRHDIALYPGISLAEAQRRFRERVEADNE